MKSLFTFLLFLTVLFRSSLSVEDEPPVPSRIKACMESQALKTYRIDSRVNPYYLRGDFDGDAKADFAVMVIGPNSKSSGLAICQGNGRHFVLGAGSRPEFSQKKDDNFLSSDWEVLTLAEFRDQVYDKKAAANAKGEVILLSWEDGSSYIYWDGTAYHLLSEVAGGSSD